MERKEVEEEWRGKRSREGRELGGGPEKEMNGWEEGHRGKGGRR